SGRAALARVGGTLVGGGERLRGGDHQFLRLAFSAARFGDAHLALVVRMLEIDDLRIELGRLLVQIGALGSLLLLPLDGGGEALFGISLALAPLGLLAAGGARPLPVRSSLARLGRRLRALVGDQRSG